MRRTREAWLCLLLLSLEIYSLAAEAVFPSPQGPIQTRKIQISGERVKVLVRLYLKRRGAYPVYLYTVLPCAKTLVTLRCKLKSRSGLAL